MAYSRILALASRSASDLSVSVILAARRRISVALMVVLRCARWPIAWTNGPTQPNQKMNQLRTLSSLRHASFRNEIKASVRRVQACFTFYFALHFACNCLISFALLPLSSPASSTCTRIGIAARRIATRTCVSAINAISNSTYYVVVELLERCPPKQRRRLRPRARRPLRRRRIRWWRIRRSVSKTKTRARRSNSKLRA